MFNKTTHSSIDNRYCYPKHTMKIFLKDDKQNVSCFFRDTGDKIVHQVETIIIIDSRVRNEKRQFHVKWLGYPDEEIEWKYERDLPCEEN